MDGLVRPVFSYFVNALRRELQSGLMSTTETLVLVNVEVVFQQGDAVDIGTDKVDEQQGKEEGKEQGAGASTTFAA